MQLPSIAHRRVHISVRFDRILPDPGKLAEALERKRARAEALSQREHWEHEVVSQIGWIK